MLPAERLREALVYVPATGLFRWRVCPRGRGKVGKVAGNLNCAGYVVVTVDGKHHMAHRLAFLYMTGKWPKDQIDHRDADKANNRWANLREATQSQNNANTRSRSTHGVKGVSRNGKRYMARIKVKGETIHLGTFNTVAEAAAIYALAARDLHGEFARVS